MPLLVKWKVITTDWNLKEAAFIKYGSFSHINDSVLYELKKNFPDYRFDVIDLVPDKYSLETARALFHCLLQYGREVLFGPKKFLEVYNRTDFFYKALRKKYLKLVSGKEYLFTFQTQALFDASLPGVPHFLYTDHSHLENLRYPGYDKRLISWPWAKLESKTYHNATRIFTMSSNISRSMTEDYDIDPGQISLVYGGANVHVPSGEKLDGSRFRKKNILFIGVDWERKGGPALAEAFKLVLQKHPTATLTIVGCVPDVNLPNTNIAGKVDLDGVKKYLEEATVFCLPTNVEPFGIVFLEAMAYKLPVVATGIGSIPDFIHHGKNGYLVTPGDVKAIADYLSDLLYSPSRCIAFGKYGMRLVKGRYTWEATVRRMHDLIETQLESGKAQPAIVARAGTAG